MRNRILIGILTSAFLLTGTVLPVYAAPNQTETAIVSEETVDVEETTEEITLDEVTDEIEENLDEETIDVDEENVDSEETDETGDEIITHTVHDEVNTVQLSLYCKMPEYFTVGVRMVLLHTETGDLYEITATKANKYYGKLYVPAGEYSVNTVMVDNDTTNKYPMTYPDTFVVEDNANHSIETTMTNFDEVQTAAYAKLGLDENGNPIEVKPTPEPTEEVSPIAEYIDEKNIILPWREVKHNGTGTGTLTIKGTPNDAYNLIIEITATGIGKNAEYKYSTDGGTTWSNIAIVQSKEDINATNSVGTSTGISLRFDSSGEYIEGDTYIFNSDHEYLVSVKDTIYGDGTIRYSSDGVVPGGDQTILLEITQTGNLGNAQFKYSSNNGLTYSANITIPENGKYIIPDTNITITFFEGEGNFVVGDKWNCTIDGVTTQKDYIPYIITGVVFVFIVIVGVFLYFYNLKDKYFEYNLMSYQKYDRTKLPSKKEKGSKKHKKVKEEDVTEETEDSEDTK